MMELLSPAGSVEAVRAAVNAGAGAIYLGYGAFNARRRAKNFTEEDLRWAVNYCHERGVRVFLTENTLVRSRELPQALDIGGLANDIGIDAVLVQDLGLARALKSRYPDLPLHASTQMTVHSLDGVKLCADAGMERVVVSRELSRSALEHICAHSPVEIETFVHGALCMCYSGQCFLSAMLGGRSGNRGLCAQPCRLPYSCNRGKMGHPLSLKDASLAGYLKDLEDMGIACVKIEGRMKRAEYVSIVTRVYAAAMREHREPTAKEMAELTAAFSRDGFTQGYFLDQKGPKMFGTRTEGENTDALFAAERERYRKDAQLIDVTMTFTGEIGKTISVSVSDPQGHTVTQTGGVAQPALHRATTAEEISAQLSKTGGTPYRVASVEVMLDEGVSIPKSELNALRRDLLEELSALRTVPPQRRVLDWDDTAPLFSGVIPGKNGGKTEVHGAQTVENTPLNRENTAQTGEKPGETWDETGIRCGLGVDSTREMCGRDGERLCFTLSSAAQLTPDLWNLPHRRIDLPAEELYAHQTLAAQALAGGAKLCAQLPRICWDEEKPELEEKMEALAALGISDVLVPTWDLVYPAARLGFTLHGDFGLGVCNEETAKALGELGFRDFTLSFELKTPQLRDLAKEFDCEAICYGKLPLMVLEQFPGGKKVQKITDRLGVSFPVREVSGQRAELLNSQTLYLADREDFKALPLKGLRFLFTEETPGKCVEVAREYLDLIPPTPPKSFTRGLYYRDVD